MISKATTSIAAVLSLFQLPSSTLGTNIDLSQDFPRDEAAIASSPGALAMQKAASQDPLVRAFMVVENGTIVTNYHRDDVDPDETTSEVFSTTKSWISLLIGMLVEDGKLALNETLGDVFPSDEVWTDVSDESIDFRKNVTIEELLTMSSGLISPPNFMLDWSWGGSSLEDSLSYPDIGVKGEFSYLATSNIPSYIIKERSGMNPREYLATHVMGKLGISEDEYEWQQNDDGMNFGYFGLELTPMQMAKFGQLYLQGGQTNPSNDDRIISQEWIDASFTPYTKDSSTGLSYGYLFWAFPLKSGVYCAFGLGGQDVCIDRELGRVLVQQKDLNEDIDMQGLEHVALASIALNDAMSFRANDGGLTEEDVETPTFQSDTSGGNMNLMDMSLWTLLLGLSVQVLLC